VKIIELFAGLGSQTQALVNLGIEHEVAAISEIDRFALISYEALHGKPNNLGDITEIAELPSADLWTYSFPCTDISLAGKQAGLYGTRSGLLWEVERLLKIAAENGTLPKYLLLENVKPLVGAKFKPDFDKWLGFLSALGYTNYWQVLNTRNYCIPQNRERVFCVSIRGEHEPYRFPEKRELRLRLKDMLDAVVEEKYYLSEQAMKSLGTSAFMIEKTRLQNSDGVHRTLCARDYKSPTCIQAGTLTGEKWDKMQEMSRRVYDTGGIAPTVHCAGGGNTEPKIIDDSYKCREPRVYDDAAPTIRSGRFGFKVVAGQFQPVNRDYKNDGEPRAEHFECRGDDVANAVLTGDRKNCIQIAALRGRQYAEGGEWIQRLETGEDGVTNALTSVQKDNLVIEPQVLKEQRTEYGKVMRKECEAGLMPGFRKTMRKRVPRIDGVTNTLTTVHKDNLVVEPDSFVGRGYKDFVKKKGYMPEMFNPYNRAEIKDCAPTLTTQCGSAESSSAVLKADDAEVSRCVRVGGHGLHERHTWDVIAIKEATKKGYAEAEPGDGVNTQFPNSETRRGRVGKGVAQTLQCNDAGAVVTESVRIRKLTPMECLRLQGWRDAEIAKIRAAGVSGTQMYRQAGNGITVTVLMAIFGELFGVPYKELLDGWRY